MLKNKRDKRQPSDIPPHDNSAELDHDAGSLTMAHTLWNSPRERRKFMQKYRTQFASAGATVLSTFAATPFDNVKTRMQSHNFKNVIDCTKYTWKTEGLRGFFAGAVPPLMSVTLVRMTSFTVYQSSKYFLSDNIEKVTGEAPLDIVNTPGRMPNLSTIFCFTTAGVIAGVATTPIACPFELAKNAVQTSALMANKPLAESEAFTASKLQKKHSRIGTAEAIKQILRLHGLRGLYTGFPLHLARDGIGTGLYFGIYESTKQAMVAYQGVNNPVAALPVAIAGGLCGIVSWICTYPLDTKKTRAQSLLLGSTRDKLGTASTDAAPTQSGAFRGLGVSLLRTGVLNVVLFSSFEYFKKKIRHLEV